MFTTPSLSPGTTHATPGVITYVNWSEIVSLPSCTYLKVPSGQIAGVPNPTFVGHDKVPFTGAFAAPAFNATVNASFSASLSLALARLVFSFWITPSGFTPCPSAFMVSFSFTV